MSKSWKRDNIFDIINSQDALQIAFKSHPKTSMGNRSKSTEVQIPDFEKQRIVTCRCCAGSDVMIEFCLKSILRSSVIIHIILVNQSFPSKDRWRTEKLKWSVQGYQTNSSKSRHALMGFVHLILLKLQMYLNTENLPNETTENVLITLLFFLKIYSSSIPWYVNAFFPTKKITLFNT